MDIFNAVAEPTRRSILEMLAAKGQMSATDIGKKFHASLPAISQHLKVLREADLVHVEKRAQQRLYQLNPAALRGMEDWTKRLHDAWDEKFDRFEAVLEREKKNYKPKK